MSFHFSGIAALEDGAVLNDGIVSFDLLNPHRPTRLGWWHHPGMRGACSWRDGLLAFHADGFFSIDCDGRTSKVGPACEAFPIMDALLGHDVVYVLTDEALDVRSQTFCKISSSLIQGGRCITYLGHRLVVGGRNGLAVYDTSQERQPSLVTSRYDCDVTSVMIPPDAPSGSVLAELVDGSARIFTIRDERLEESTVYSGTPWFAESVDLGNILVSIDADRHYLNVATSGESQLVVPKHVPPSLYERVSSK